MAIGGSTNAIIHLIAMAGRAGIKLPLERFDEISQRTPVIANLRPSGEYLMEDFYDAGGLPRAARTASAVCCTSTASPSPARRSARTSTARRSSTTR